MLYFVPCPLVSSPLFASWLPRDEKPPPPLSHHLVFYFTSGSKGWIQGSHAKTSETMRSEVDFLRHVCHWAPKLTNTNSLFLGGGPKPIQPREKDEFSVPSQTLHWGWLGWAGKRGKSSLGQNPGLVLPSESGLMPKASEAGPGQAQTLGDCWVRFIPAIPMVLGFPTCVQRGTELQEKLPRSNLSL